MEVKQYDTVLLKDGRTAAIVEAFDNKVFIADVGSSSRDWDTIDITIDDIEEVVSIPGKQFDRLDNLEELTNSIDMGSDIEFNLYGVRYNISTDGTPFIAVCPDGDGVFYQNARDMVEHHSINGILLKDAWKDIEILFM